MDREEFPAPEKGFLVTHTIIVEDIDRSREFYRDVFGAKVVWEGGDAGPAMLKLANSWLIINVGGAPTDDKPTVVATPPREPDTLSAFLNLRVADIRQAYDDWRARGARFLTEPKEHESEFRAYIRDPDGHLIEVGQTKERVLPS